MGAERLGRYMVLRHLASGGMADVLLGRSDGIEGFVRHVVIKKIKAEHAKDRRFIQMFLDEARVAASLHHQNIVQVHDIGEANGEYFFAMEYVHGEDLRSILSAVSKAKQHMPLGHVATIISAAAAALHYAHERRGSDKKPQHIVHRDVSPSNIILGYDGAIKLLDFGIAKAAMRQVETRSGSLKGKVSYMSPEQCKGESSIDRRSDVYSLGVVMYELATTTRLFKGDSDYMMMDAIVNGKAPLPRVKRPDLPNDLSSIIMRAMAVDPNRRYQSAEELRLAIDQFAAKSNLTTSTQTIASYMKKLFGERPEPWLDSSSTDAPPVDAEAHTDAAKPSPRSWTEIPRDSSSAVAAGAATTDDDKTRSDRKSRRSGAAKIVPRELATADTMPPPFKDPSEPTRTSTKLGWEQQPPATATSDGAAMKMATKVALVAAPVVVALIGIGLWQFVFSSSGDKKVAAASEPNGTATPPASPSPVAPTAPSATPTPTPATPTPAPTATPTPNAPPTPNPPPIATPTPTPAPIAPPTPAPPTRPSTPPVVAKAPPKAPPAIAAKKPDAKPADPKPTPTVTTPTPTPTVAPAPAPAVATTPTPTPAPTPAPEPPMAQLSPATVSAIAADHAAQLSKCESGELHGDVSVAFQIDGTGKVVKSQLSSTINNTKIAACILTAVRSWSFPRPPSGAAKGLYTINYQ